MYKPNPNLINEIKISKKTGIAYVDDGSTGCRYTVHPSIDVSGSVIGMKNLGYWGKHDRIERFGSAKYNIDILSYDRSSDLETEIANRCQCESCLERRYEE